MSIPPLNAYQAEEVERTIESFECGRLTYDQAHRMLVEICEDHPALYLCQIELYAAWELKFGPLIGFKI